MATRCYTAVSLEQVTLLTTPGVAAADVSEENMAMHRLCGLRPMGGSRARVGLALLTALVLAAVASTTANAAPPNWASSSWASNHVDPRVTQESRDASSDGAEIQVIAYGDDAKNALTDAGARQVKKLELIGGAVGVVRVRDMEQILADGRISYVASNAPVQLDATVDPAALQTLYPTIDGAAGAWPAGFDGDGVGIALIDSGAADLSEFAGRLTRVTFDPSLPADGDQHGHGTFVAGIAGGASADGRYIGVAPKARLYALDVQRGDGILTSDIVNALGWVAQNKDRYGIRVVNLSLTETTPSAYRTSALDAAVEAVWRAGVVVVVSAGNSGAGSIDFAPANDPFVVTVGAIDTNFTLATADDTQATWSSRGTTVDGFVKPELLAPGRGIVSTVPTGTTLDALAPLENHVQPGYLRMNGTSASAPQVAGAIALLLQKRPELVPDQVKWLLQATSRPFVGAAPGLDVAGALAFAATPASANGGLTTSSGIPGDSGSTQTAAGFERQAAAYEDKRLWDQAGRAWEKAAGTWSSPRNVAIASHNAAADWMLQARWERVAAREADAADAWSQLGSPVGAGIAWELAADASLKKLDFERAAQAFESAARAWTTAGGADRASASWKRAADAWRLKGDLSRASAAQANVAATWNAAGTWNAAATWNVAATWTAAATWNAAATWTLAATWNAAATWTAATTWTASTTWTAAATWTAASTWNVGATWTASATWTGAGIWS